MEKDRQLKSIEIMLDITNINNSNCKKKIIVPDGFRELLQDLAVEVLRNQPSDILGFSIDYLSQRRTLLISQTQSEGEKKKFGINKLDKGSPQDSKDVSSQKGSMLMKGMTVSPEKVIEESYLFANVDKTLISKFVSNYEVKNVSVGEEFKFINVEESPIIYFVQSGKLELFDGTEPGKNKIAELVNRGYFGDTSEDLVVVAKTASKLILVNRTKIDASVLEGIKKRREEYSDFINDMDLFEKLSNYSKRIIIDCMIEKQFDADQEIIVEGEDGMEMFLVYEGFVSVKIGSKEVNSIGEGGYFGELAVIDNEPRAANVLTVSEAKLMAIPADILKTIIEPICKDQLDERIKSYYKNENDDDEDDESDMITPPPQTGNFPRKSVSAGKFNPEMDDDDDDEDMFEGINSEDLIKTDEQRVRLRKCCKNILLFRCLDDEQLEVVISAMFQRIAKPGDVIIKRGDDGDNFYVVDNGIYDIIVPVNDVDTVVAQYKHEGSFGELALMYNTPRSATVIAKTDGLLWAMNREMFRKIVLKKAFQKRLMYESLLGQVSLFKNISSYERTNIADALKTKAYDEGETIITQGDEGLEMFFIEEGMVEIFVLFENSEEPEMIGELDRGKYFGEMALINHKPRAATISAKTKCKIAVLDRESFERLLGPCVDVMKRNMAEYDAPTPRKSMMSLK